MEWSDTEVGKGSTWAHGCTNTRMFCVHTQRVSCGVRWWLYRVCVMQFTTSHHRNWIPMEFRISKSLPSVSSHLPHAAAHAVCGWTTGMLLMLHVGFCYLRTQHLSAAWLRALSCKHFALKSRVQIDKMDGGHRLACGVTDSMMILWVVLHYDW